MMNYEITVNEGDKIIKVLAIHNKLLEEIIYKYSGYGFRRMTDRYSDSPLVFVIELQDGGSVILNLNNVSEIIYN